MAQFNRQRIRHRYGRAGGAIMIDLYFWPTPNGYKITIFLEEVGLPYKIIPVNIGKGDQFQPEFLKISPNNRMPAIIDHEGPGGNPFSLFESGAILMYLAEKTGKLMPAEMGPRYRVVEWLMFQMANVGPMLGQAGHFLRAAPEKIPYAIERYTNESRRIFNVIDKRLGEVAYLAGEYSIADIACYPWVMVIRRQPPEELESRPNLKRWLDAISERPAVKRGMAVMADRPSPATLDPDAREILYGAKQYQRR
jgi:GST-like protein